MEKKKSNFALIIVIVVLVIALLGTSGYIVYDKIIVKDQNKVTTQEDKKDETSEDKKDEITVADKTKIMSQIEVYVGKYANKFHDFKVSNLTNNELLLFALGYDKSEVHTSQSMKTVIKQYFGDINVIDANIVCAFDNKVFYNYNNETKTYTYNENHPGHGGGTSYTSDNEYIDGYSEDNQYTVNVKILYGTTCGDTCGPTMSYYKNIDDVVNNTNALFNLPYVDYKVSYAEYQSLFDKLSETTFTFEKDSDGNFALKTITIK